MLGAYLRQDAAQFGLPMKPRVYDNEIGLPKSPARTPGERREPDLLR